MFRDATRPAVINQLSEINLSSRQVLTNQLARLLQLIAVFRPGVKVSRRSVRRDGDVAGNQIPVLTIYLLRDFLRFEFETCRGLRQDQSHREISVADSSPLNLTVNTLCSDD